MAKLTLNSNEYTVETLLDKIRAQHNLKKMKALFRVQIFMIGQIREGFLNSTEESILRLVN